MAKKKLIPISAFLDTAEAIMREQTKKHDQLLFWRGMFPHKMLGHTLERDTIIIGFSDEKGSSSPPTIPVMTVYIDGFGGFWSAEIAFRTGSSTDVSMSTPFGGGHKPINEVRELAERLPSLPRL
ncbi:MAG: hypothetical protein Q7S34_01795 [bacterium]|nr:hypothetical protein [bacterium]